MGKILLACDLDNTLLYSYQHRQPGDLCVEMLGGREQGFMTPRTAELLKAVTARVELVPVTTRSIEQYNRICWPAGCTPAYAAVANGAVLLKHGAEEPSWSRGSADLIAPYARELSALLPEFSDRERFLRCRIVDGAYLFVCCAGGVSAEDCAAAYRPRTRLNVVSSGKKVYFFPPEINKGSALRRLRALLRPDAVIAAGDSAIDVPMLQGADLALLPASFPDTVHAPHLRAPGDRGAFAEFVLETVLAGVCSPEKPGPL